MTKANFYRYRTYEAATASELHEIYKSFSADKARALRKIRNDMRDLHGSRLRVFSPSTFSFSAAFQYSDSETGVLRCRCYTSSNTYDFEVSASNKRGDQWGLTEISA